MPVDFTTIRAVFFDAVGTLIYPDPPVGEAYARIGRRHAARLGVAEIERRFRAAFRAQEELDRTLCFRTDETRERQRWRAIVTEVFHDQPDPLGPCADLWEHFARPEAWTCFADVADLLQGLADQGIKVGIASNYDARLRTVVAGLPALSSCQALAISAEIGWRKPAAPFFEALCRMIGEPPEHVAVIGDDWENDYQGGQAAGLQVLLLDRKGVRPGVPSLSTLRDLPRVWSSAFKSDA
jgi:putative hydrolase of the HAD superfamily